MSNDDLIARLRELADKFSEGWHDGICIDASDVMDLSKAADALTAQANSLGFLRQISEQQAYEITQQAAEIEALRADAERWRYAVNHCEWRRTDDEDGRYSMLVVRLPYDADQSCVAMRNHAIDAAMQSGKAVTP